MIIAKETDISHGRRQ